MERYVVGFCFNGDMSKVVLIQKNRPAWQVGKLNGVGGMVKLHYKLCPESSLRKPELISITGITF